MSIIMCPEQKRGVLERGTTKLYLLELDRTVILFNEHKRNGSKNMAWFSILLDNHRTDAHIDHDA